MCSTASTVRNGFYHVHILADIGLLGPELQSTATWSDSADQEDQD